MIASNTKRPRNVDAPRAAAILYGDWGTSKAYVIGLAFAVAGYSSFWLIAAMCLLTALVGVNYMAICKHYPDGGGVYASVRHRSEIISIVGAFLLVADYIVTAAISALSAFQYLGLPHPEICAAIAIAVIGGLNYFGPRHTAGLAFLISVPTVIVVVALGLFSLPHLVTAAHNLQPLSGGFWKNWSGFVGVVLALSGVEAIANATGVMKLNPGGTDAKPCVSKTSTRAVLWVMIEVCAFTALLGLAMHALPNLVVNKDDVDATALGGLPANPGVRDYRAHRGVGGEHCVRGPATLGGEHGHCGFDCDFVSDVAGRGITAQLSKAEPVRRAEREHHHCHRDSSGTRAGGQRHGGTGGPVRGGGGGGHCNESGREFHGQETWSGALGADADVLHILDNAGD